MLQSCVLHHAVSVHVMQCLYCVHGCIIYDLYSLSLSAPVQYENFYNPTAVATNTAATAPPPTTHIPQKDMPLPPLPTEAKPIVDCECMVTCMISSTLLSLLGCSVKIIVLIILYVKLLHLYPVHTCDSTVQLQN